jgi:heme A synthase
MSTLTEKQAGPRPQVVAERLRMASFGALTMLVLQFVLGTAYNLYGTAPTASKSVGWFSSPLLAIHVILGILIVIAAIALVVRAASLRGGRPPRTPPEGRLEQAKAGPVLYLSIGGLVAVLAAFGAGSAFAGHGNNGDSLGMAVATAAAMLCYAANMVILGKQRG